MERGHGQFLRVSGMRKVDMAVDQRKVRRLGGIVRLFETVCFAFLMSPFIENKLKCGRDSPTPTVPRVPKQRSSVSLPLAPCGVESTLLRRSVERTWSGLFKRGALGLPSVIVSDKFITQPYRL